MSLYLLIKAVLRPATGLLFDAKVDGEDNVPMSGPLVVAANHRSFLDPPMLGTWFPRVVDFMAKEELFKIPVLGYLISKVHAFPVSRDTADIGSFLKAGGVVGIFPEGTRNVTGESKAKGGAVLLAATAHCPLVPVGLARTSLAVHRWRASHVEVRIGKPIELQGSARKATKAEIEAWTSQLSDELARLSNPQM